MRERPSPDAAGNAAACPQRPLQSRGKSLGPGRALRAERVDSSWPTLRSFFSQPYWYLCCLHGLMGLMSQIARENYFHDNWISPKSQSGTQNQQCETSFEQFSKNTDFPDCLLSPTPPSVLLRS